MSDFLLVEARHFTDGSVEAEVVARATGETVARLRVERGPATAARGVDAFAVELWTRAGEDEVERGVESGVTSMAVRRTRATTPKRAARAGV